MVRRLFSLFLLLVFIASCSSVQMSTSTDRVADYFSEIQMATIQRESLWNLDLNGPILLVEPETRRMFSNYTDNSGIVKKNGSVFTGILPDNINIANTSIAWSGRVWAMIVLPLPEDKHKRINLLAHELFHRAQAKLGFTAHNPSNSHLDEKEGRILLRLELEALKKAVFATTPSEKKVHLTNAFVFRKYRWELYPGAAITENLLELNEGLAEYSGVMMSGRDIHQTQEHFIKSIDNFFGNPSFVRSFAYVTTPVYGYLLSGSAKGWNKKDWNKNIDDNTDLTEYFLNAYKIKLPKNLERKVTEVRERYNGQSISTEESEREGRIRKVKAGYISEFVQKPHLDIYFEQMNVSFDPRNIFPLDNLGTVYPVIRVTDNWGILTVEKGALMSPSWNKITITMPAEIGKNKASGDGWILELNDGFAVKKDGVGKNFILTKK